MEWARSNKQAAFTCRTKTFVVICSIMFLGRSCTPFKFFAASRFTKFIVSSTNPSVPSFSTIPVFTEAQWDYENEMRHCNA